MRRMNDLVPYDVARFDEGYYKRGDRGGFKNYDYDSPVQRDQLAIKWQCGQFIPHRNVLFIGCACGFEVAHWRERGIAAWGVDVSEWAIRNSYPDVKEYCLLFDGKQLDWANDSFDLVCAF